MTLLAMALQVLLAVGLAPLLMGAMRTTRARLEGRRGPGVLQPYRDLRKLFAKIPLRAQSTGILMEIAPVLAFWSSLVVCALIPTVATLVIPGISPDLFVAVSFLLIGTVALALVGLESGSAFGGMGSSRHMMIGALVEPTVLLSVYALSVPVGSSSLAAIVEARLGSAAILVSPVSLLAIAALIFVTIAETGRIPVDNPSTHLELTMIHEAMILESSARDLAWLEWGSWLRLWAFLGLITSLLLPFGIATTATPLALLLGLAAAGMKIVVAGCLIAAVEVFLAKIRLFRVPELLAGSCVLAFLAVAAAYLLQGVA